MRRRHIRATVVLGLAGLAATSLAVLPTAHAQDQRTPVDLAADAIATAAGACDELDTRLCLLPFPNDQFTTLDPTTPTGRRVSLSPLATPRSFGAKPMDPTEWNRNDGFSPGSMILTFVPGLDLTATFGLDPEPESGAGSPTADDPFATRDELPDAVVEAPGLSMAPDAPIVLLDADTGERHPYWAELDEHAATLAEGHDRTLIVRPLVNLEEGRRYIVGLRDLRASDGTELAPTPAFTALRDGYQPPVAEERGPDRGQGNGKGKKPKPPPAPAFPAPADIDPADRAGRYQDIFTRLHAAGVAVDDLHLAWDFHVASAQNLAGRALAIRDDAFAQLGDDDLADLQVEGASPTMSIGDVTEETDDQGRVTRTVHGTVTVPNYLTTPQDGASAEQLGAAEDAYDQLPAELRDADPFLGDALGLAGDVPVITPQSRFVYASPTPGPMDTPIQNPVLPTMEAEFTCKLPVDVDGGAKPTLYGHGLLGGRGEVEGGSTGDLRRAGHAMCGVDWIGMATEDITNVALILHDISFFPSLADRAQQGFLNFMYVGRALLHRDGAVAQAAFEDTDGRPLLDTTELFYDGNSQGGIMGGALTALAPDFTKAVLGVPGMNYSTLLNRSVDWEGEFFDPEEPGIPAYGSFTYNAYPDQVGQQLVFALLQMLWDRGEGNGYAHHMTNAPYPNTPAHQVLLEVAFGDYQVSNLAAEVQARTIGADFLTTALAPGRHWERAVAAGGGAPYGMNGFTDGRSASGSALVYWDSGNPTPPNGNVPPADLGQDPHGDPRNDDVALVQKQRFYDTGEIVDVHGGQPNWTFRCPRHPERNPGCPGA